MTPTHPVAGGDAPRTAIPLEHEQTPLWEELSQHLDEHSAADLAALGEELERTPWRGAPAGEAIHRAVACSDSAPLVTLAHRLGREWLAGG
jgi:hypothetical protein